MKIWVIGLALASLAASPACGGSSRRTDAEAVAGADAVGGSAPGPVVGDAGMSAGHSGGVGGSGGGSGGVGGGSGENGGIGAAGAPPLIDLIKGDPECPPMASPGPSCSDAKTSCVYRTVVSGLSEFGPAHCACKDGTWACVSSDENGDSACPLTTYPPGADDPCPAPGTECQFPALNAVATCRCSGTGGGSGGWSCGL